MTCGIEPVTKELPRGVLDIDWIPRVAAHGWVAITKNHKIRPNPVEARAAVEAKARIVGFAGRSGNMTSWHDNHLGPTLDRDREPDRIGPVGPLVAKRIQSKGRVAKLPGVDTSRR